MRPWLVVATSVAATAALVLVVITLRVPDADTPTTADGDDGLPDPAAIDVGLRADASIVFASGTSESFLLRETGLTDTGYSASFAGDGFDRLSVSVVGDVERLIGRPAPTSEDLRLVVRLGSDTWTSASGECTIDIGPVVGGEERAETGDRTWSARVPRERLSVMYMDDGAGFRFTCGEMIGSGLAGVALAFPEVDAA